MTRNEYMANSGYENHRTYFAQFVTPALELSIAASIGGDRILASDDPFLNDIPLAEWDRLESITKWHAQKLLKDIGGDFWTLGNSVCIAKEAARLWKESV